MEISEDQLLPDHSEQDGIRAVPHTMISSTSPAGGVFELPSTNLSLSAEGPSMGRMTWHQATPQRLEPVGQDRDHGIGIGPVVRRRAGVMGIPRRSRLTIPALDRTNLALSRLG